MSRFEFIFQTYDMDKDGFWNAEDFISFLYELGKQEKIQGQFNACFEFMNVSKSGKIDLQEFKERLPQLYQVQLIPESVKSNPEIIHSESPHYHIYEKISKQAESDEEAEKMPSHLGQVREGMGSNSSLASVGSKVDTELKPLSPLSPKEAPIQSSSKTITAPAVRVAAEETATQSALQVPTMASSKSNHSIPESAVDASQLTITEAHAHIAVAQDVPKPVEGMQEQVEPEKKQEIKPEEQPVEKQEEKPMEKQDEKQEEKQLEVKPEEQRAEEPKVSVEAAKVVDAKALTVEEPKVQEEVKKPEETKPEEEVSQPPVPEMKIEHAETAEEKQDQDAEAEDDQVYPKSTISPSSTTEEEESKSSKQGPTLSRPKAAGVAAAKAAGPATLTRAVSTRRPGAAATGGGLARNVSTRRPAGNAASTTPSGYAPASKAAAGPTVSGAAKTAAAAPAASAAPRLAPGAKDGDWVAKLKETQTKETKDDKKEEKPQWVQQLKSK